ncbi:uncharacterized protein LOC135335443 [Halichondria panicea]|uniref:uncharacterized protein LOC135335443 n=1 Tax=Halichondria panicea TaxID=6063 RepID=UPI00312B3F02
MKSICEVFGKSASAASGSGSSKASAAKKPTTEKCWALQVEKKLRRHKKYRNLGGKELQEEVERLTKVDNILENFSHLVQEVLIEQVKELDENSDVEWLNSTEVGEAQTQQRCRSVNVARIPLKITVRDLRSNRKAQRLLETFADIFKIGEYGAKHVSLTVGDVVLEWGKESLVVPYWELEQKERSVKSDARDITSLSTHNAEATAAPEVEPWLLPIEDEVEHLFYRTSEKLEVFQRLAEVISQYNTMHHYDVLKRNCQAFVIDALKAVGISDKVPIKVEESERMQQLRVKKLSEIPDSFATHEDLDFFISEKSQRWLDELDPESLEYLQLVYSQFHGDNNTGCHVTDCRLFMITPSV